MSQLSSDERGPQTPPESSIRHIDAKVLQFHSFASSNPIEHDSGRGQRLPSDRDTLKLPILCASVHPALGHVVSLPYKLFGA